MSKKKKPAPVHKPLTPHEADTIFARIERGCSSDSEETGLIRRLVAYPDVSIPFLIGRIKNGNFTDQGFAGHIIALIGGNKVKQPLRELSLDPSISPGTKSVVLSTLNDLGEDVEAEFDAITQDSAGPKLNAIIEEFMKGATANEQLTEAIVLDLEQWQHPDRDQLIRLIGERGGDPSLRLLLPLLHAREKLTIMAAIDALDVRGLPDAVPALNLLSEVSPIPEIRNRARTVCSKLAAAAISVPDASKQAPIKAAVPLPLFKAMVTAVDGDGTQMVIVSRKQPDGILKTAYFMFNDYQGVKDCHGSETTVKELNKTLSEFGGPVLVPLSVPLCRALLDDAISINKKVHRKLPMGLEIWRHLLQDGPEAARLWQEDESFLIPQETVLDPALIDRSAKLLEMPFFDSWGFDGRHLEISDIVAFDAVARSHAKKAEKVLNLEAVLQSVVRRIAKPKLRTTLERRLRRQAWLLKRLGQTDLSRVTLATASAVNPRSGIPLEEQPFLRAMVAKSIIMMRAELEDRHSPSPGFPPSRE